jgi:hypothetical protein
MTGPFHVVLRTAIQQRGLPLERLRARLAERGIRIGLSSLSDWQHGRAWPERANSLRAVRALEDILGLPNQALTGLLTAHAAHPFQPKQGVDEYSGPLGELLDAIPGSRSWDLDALTTEHQVTVDEDRRVSVILIRSLVKARRPGVDRATVRYFGSPDCVIDEVVVEPLRNCRTGQVHRHQGGRVLVAELLFDQRLQAGETWIFELRLHDPTSSERTDFAHGFRRPEANFLLEIRFRPATLPTRVYGYFRTNLYTELRVIEELRLNAHHAAHLATADMTAGVLGIGWEW